MDALNVVLIFGAFLLALFTLIFSAGSLIHLSGLIKEALGVTAEVTPGWLKTAAVVLGVLAIGFVAVAVVDHKDLSLHALAAPGGPVAEATAGIAADASGQGPRVEGRLSPGSSDSMSLPAGAPRECSLAQGIVAECTFN